MSSLEAQLLDRNSRLAALRNKRRPQNTVQSPVAPDTTSALSDTLIVAPSADANQAQETVHTEALLDDEASSPSAAPTFEISGENRTETIEAISLSIQNKFLNEHSRAIQAELNDLNNQDPDEMHQPLKPHQQLMERLQDKVTLLEERTTRSLREILKQRIEEERQKQSA
ncbi:hypothetical protein BABINDRAFT_5514 [Babjeviella inositovora NRRL Y-12698]|uniref:Uncharacterized protein n=1 Tax=Babjeviella inositovora NRRL Y-12698 TaxID=984486 RepID=A0A1E3QZQ3_9ASCO|nr:uncharacterized protein BABINDRAFT_5514 [Babjeviella inositovora NRRL Y-12698]ODQ82567.1 hypothetical protein BABINDRAFT_5514 [Babjeviella inositovora NRRL Y-12698]